MSTENSSFKEAKKEQPEVIRKKKLSKKLVGKDTKKYFFSIRNVDEWNKVSGETVHTHTSTLLCDQVHTSVDDGYCRPGLLFAQGVAKVRPRAGCRERQGFGGEVSRQRQGVVRGRVYGAAGCKVRQGVVRGQGVGSGRVL